MAHTNEPYYIFIWYKKSGSLCIFVQYHSRLANLYIFRKVITREVRKDIGMVAILDFQNGQHKIHIWPYFCLWSP